MKTWNDYKEHVRTVDPEIGKDIDEVENISSIVSAMVEQRTSLGLSQRELAAIELLIKNALCGCLILLVKLRRYGKVKNIPRCRTVG